jgi:RsiW-degrading membrane proteinase PrsW (M82 family)
VLVALGLLVVAFQSPWSIVAGLIPLAIVLPVLEWLDRVEPEPLSSRVHAVLWGASVAIVVALVVNTVVGVVAGEVAAMVISAPLVEEVAKAFGIVWAVRRNEVDSVSDGVVYAGWVALGFAVVEDISYFTIADIEGAFAETVVLRGFLTPFAHPLFTFWTGLAIGRAVFRGKRIWPAMSWGLALSVLTHALWNGTLVLGDLTYTVDEDLGAAVLLAGVGVFLLLFIGVAVALVVHRRREQGAFAAQMGGLVVQYGVAPHEAAMFTGWSAMLRARRQLPRGRRGDFDRVHAALARLAVLHRRPGDIDPAAERVLVAQLGEALARFRA